MGKEDQQERHERPELHQPVAVQLHEEQVGHRLGVRVLLLLGLGAARSAAHGVGHARHRARGDGDAGQDGRRAAAELEVPRVAGGW